jgi:hypothetical protein
MHYLLPILDKPRDKNIHASSKNKELITRKGKQLKECKADDGKHYSPTKSTVLFCTVTAFNFPDFLEILWGFL